MTSIRPLKAVAKVINGYPFPSARFADEGFPLVRIRDIAAGRTDTYFSGPWEEAAAINTGDVLVGMDGDFNLATWQGGPALLNQRVCCVRGVSAEITRYLAYYLPDKLQAINDVTYATTVKHLSSVDVENIPVLVPDPRKITGLLDYLDAKTAAIDALIAKKELLLEELRKYQEAVIDETLHDAGIVRQAPLKRLFRVSPSNVDKHAVEGEPSVRLCNYVDVYRNDCIDETLPFMPATASVAQVAKFTLKAGDVLITKDSESPTDIAIPAYVPADLPGVVCGYHLAVLRARSDAAVGEYLYWILRSTPAHNYFSGAATGVSRYALSIDDVGSLPISLPSPAEQRRIAAHLKSLSTQNQSAALTLKASVQELKAYRAALISEAVTGNISV